MGNVENTALSTWAGSSNITTLGTIATGAWSADTIAVNKGGTGQTSYANGQLLIGSGTSLVKNTLTAGTGIAINNGSGSIGINVDSTVIRTVGEQIISSVKTFNALIKVQAAPLYIGGYDNIPETIVSGSMLLINNTANIIEFNSAGVSSPPNNSVVATGSKLILKPSDDSNPNVSLGLNTFSWWHSVPTTSWDYEWYAGGSKIATLFGDGTFNTTNISGTNFYLNGTQISATAAQINLLSTGNDGDILFREGGYLTRIQLPLAMYGYITSSSLDISYVNSQVQINHRDQSSVSNTATNFPSGTVVSNLSFDAYGHVVNASGSNLDERYVQISNLDTSLNFVSGISSEYDVGNKVLNVYHDDTCPTYNDSSNTLGTNGIATITFDNYGHVTDATTAIFLTAETVCDAITGCTIDGGTF